jgi:AcrR family transcriptional regulator
MHMTLSTKEQLLVAATNLLDKGGPSAVTLRAVGDAIGVSQTAPYRHFRDKRDLLEAVARDSFREVSEILDGAMSRANSPVEALMLAARKYFELARRYPMRHRLLFDIGEHGGLEAEARRAFETVTGVVAAAQHAGEIRDGDPAQMSAFFCSTVHGLSQLEQIGSANAVRALSDVDSLAQLLLGLIANKSGHRDARARAGKRDSVGSEAEAAAAVSGA